MGIHSKPIQERMMAKGETNFFERNEGHGIKV